MANNETGHSRMLTTTRRLAGAALISAGVAAVAPAASAGVFNPQSFTLDNGLRVLLLEKPAMPSVGVIIYYGVGSADELRGQSGIAHIFEHLMFGETTTFEHGAFDRFIASVGGQQNAHTSWDETAYYEIIAPEHLERALEFEADRMTNLILTPDVVEPERLVVLEEFATRISNEPSSWAQVEALATLFSHHPYGTPILGWRHEIETLSIEQMLEFYGTWYAPNNAVLAVAGAVSMDELRPLVEQYFAEIPRADTPERARIEEPPHYAPRTVYLEHPTIGQPSWSRSYLAPSYQYGASEHAYALQVLAEIMGYGTDSRFYERLVFEQGIAVSAGAYYGPDNIDHGIFGVYGSPVSDGDDEAAVAALEAAIEAEIDMLMTDGVTEEEVASAIKQLQSDAIFAQDSLMAGARTLGSALAAGRSIEDVENWPEKLGEVTVADVNAAIAYVFDPANSVTSILMPAPAE